MRHIRCHGCWQLLQLIQVIQQLGCAMLLIDVTHADDPCEPKFTCILIARYRQNAR